ncbi:hypothetical protein [Nitrososphaera sp.]|uniref:hypothetical protein n=1 Tax=Nitrososphaera sp. TaxID=1971748 RepID=UPI00307D3F53
MGLITWVIVIATVLAVIGLGLGTFVSGVWSGIQTVGSNPLVQNATNEAKEVVSNATRNATGSLPLPEDSS